VSRHENTIPAAGRSPDRAEFVPDSALARWSRDPRGGLALWTPMILVIVKNRKKWEDFHESWNRNHDAKPERYP